MRVKTSRLLDGRGTGSAFTHEPTRTPFGVFVFQVHKIGHSKIAGKHHSGEFCTTIRILCNSHSQNIEPLISKFAL